MTANGMMPGQDPYTPAELTRLHAVVRDAADGDPGEACERVPVYLTVGQITNLLDALEGHEAGRCGHETQDEHDEDPDMGWAPDDRADLAAAIANLEATR